MLALSAVEQELGRSLECFFVYTDIINSRTRLQSPCNTEEVFLNVVTNHENCKHHGRNGAAIFGHTYNRTMPCIDGRLPKSGMVYGITAIMCLK